jgi:phosphoglycolate phosphatase-like HAD superfamily hydrolase
MVNLKIGNDLIENVDTVLFDKDGTLTDVHIYWGKIIEMRAWAIVQFYKLRREEYFNLQGVMGYIIAQKKLKVEGPIAIKSRKEVIWAIRKYLKKISIEATHNEIDNIITEVNAEFQTMSRSFVSIIPGVLDFIKLLAKNDVTMGLVTSDAYNNAMCALGDVGIQHYFSKVYGHENSRASKETGIPAIEIMRDLGADPANTVVIGDTMMDVNMAINSNTRCIVTATGQIPYESFVGNVPYVVKNLKNIEVSHA